MTQNTPRLPRQALTRHWLVRSPLVWVVVAAWVVALIAQLSGQGHALGHDALAEGHLPAWAALGVFVLAWQLMIVSMMLPSSLPLIRLFNQASATERRP